MTILLIVANVAVFLVSLWLALKKSEYVIPWVAVFSSIWTLPVAAIWYLRGGDAFEYASKNFAHMSLPMAFDNDLALIYFIIYFSLIFSLVGFVVADKLGMKPSIGMGHEYQYKLAVNSEVLAIFSLWALVTLAIVMLNGLPWSYVFLPAYSSDGAIYINYIFRGLYLYLPFLAVYFALENKKKKIVIVSVVAWALLISFSTGQRRDFLSFVLFFIYLKSSDESGRLAIAEKFGFIKSILCIVGAFFALIFLWMVRVIASNLLAKGEWVNPFEVRSAVEVIFGSGASGVPAFILINKEIEGAVGSLMYNVYYGVSQIIPRGLWDKKPVGVDTILQDKYGLLESPSIFWYGDYAYSFGFYLIPIATLLFAFILTGIQKQLRVSDSPSSRLMAALLFCNVFTFYKNGLGTYLAIVSTAAILMLLCGGIFKVKSRSGRLV